MRWLIIISLSGFTSAWATGNDSTKLLIADMIVQIEATEAMNAMYNFEFDEARKQYNWLRQKHPESPLAYFLLGLNEWWKMMPNTAVKTFDERFHHYMDTTVLIAEAMLEVPDRRIEGAFFLAATYGFKGRLYSDRGKWGKAASAGRSSLKYLEISREHSYLSPELLFGDGLYNYFSVWIPENYPILRPILAFFPDGDKELGLQQLREVSANAFYTRIEAQIFLMQILANDKQDYSASLAIAEYLYEHYPNNPYFHRYYARYLYSLHRYTKMEPIALEILAHVDSSKFGYEATAGRYAAFFLGQSYQGKGNSEKAKQYYNLAVEFSRQKDAMDTGYCLYSLLNLGKIAQADNRKNEAKNYFKEVKKIAGRKQTVFKEAKRLLKEL
jgi:hypothetical protein